MTNTTSDVHVDAAVIGAGSGGLTVAIGLSQFGKSVALIEAAEIGGDCTNVGCIPSKSLLHHSAHIDGRSAAEVMAKVRERRNALRDHETEEFNTKDGVTMIWGRAKIESADRLTITHGDGSTRSVTAKHLVVATGSSARRIPIEGLEDDRYLTNTELFEEQDAPSKLVIVGAGPIGIEMATAFQRLGTDVVVLDAAPRILPLYLPEASAIVERELVSRGIDVRPGTVGKHFDSATKTLHVGPLDGDATDQISDVDRVLVAVGRVPNSEGLGLEELGVEMERGRIVIDDKGRSSVDGVWACGDVTTEGATTHAANAWGRRIIKHIIAPPAPAGPRPLHPAVTFSDPEAATIGEQPEEVPSDVRRIVVDYGKIDRSYTDEVGEGIIVVDVRRFRGTVLGATIVGPRAGELISTFSLAMKNDIKFSKWYGTVWPYPAYSDGLGTAVDAYMGEALPNMHKEFAAWAKGKVGRVFSQRSS